MDPTNTAVWTRKSFAGSVVSFDQQIIGVIDPIAVIKTSVANDSNSPRDITNRNQPLLLFYMDPTNTIVWARKSFIGSVVSCGADLQQDLG
jgi:hypothetical protein